MWALSQSYFWKTKTFSSWTKKSTNFSLFVALYIYLVPSGTSTRQRLLILGDLILLFLCLLLFWESSRPTFFSGRDFLFWWTIGYFFLWPLCFFPFYGGRNSSLFGGLSNIFFFTRQWYIDLSENILSEDSFNLFIFEAFFWMLQAFYVKHFSISLVYVYSCLNYFFVWLFL